METPSRIQALLKHVCLNLQHHHESSTVQKCHVKLKVRTGGFAVKAQEINIHHRCIQNVYGKEAACVISNKGSC